MFKEHRHAEASENPQPARDWVGDLAKALRRLPESCSQTDAAWFAGLAVAPASVGPVEAAEFTGQISRLHAALRGGKHL